MQQNQQNQQNKRVEEDAVEELVKKERALFARVDVQERAVEERAVEERAAQEREVEDGKF
jgi:hypothetical protein